MVKRKLITGVVVLAMLIIASSKGVYAECVNGTKVIKRETGQTACGDTEKNNIYKCESNGSWTLVQSCASGESCSDNSSTNTASCLTAEQNGSRITDVYCTDGKSINTALGCIPIKMSDFVAWLLPILFGIAGGISFLLMVYGFILMATSSGDEKKLQGAKETITSAITGLLLSIFAIFIFRLIAYNILKIPGI